MRGGEALHRRATRRRRIEERALMRAETVARLREPGTGAALKLEPLEMDGDEVVSGRLIESETGAWHRIDEGIADLVPHGFRNAERYEAFCRDTASRTARRRPPARCRTTTRQADQVLLRRQDRYEAEVVNSPFYDVFDRVTVGRWIERTIKPGMLVAEVGCGSGRQTIPTHPGRRGRHRCRPLGRHVASRTREDARGTTQRPGGLRRRAAANLPLANRRSTPAWSSAACTTSPTRRRRSSRRGRPSKAARPSTSSSRTTPRCASYSTG